MIVIAGRILEGGNGFDQRTIPGMPGFGGQAEVGEQKALCNFSVPGVL